MPDLPSANVSLSETAGAKSTGADLITIIAPVASNADAVPRIFSGVSGILSLYGYAPGVDYAALHIQVTRKPVQFVGIPIVTAGTVGRTNASGNTGTSVVTIAAGGSGSLEECDGIVKVASGGTIGTDDILLSISLDNGVTYKKVRLGTASSYVIPSVGQTLSFGAGTLVTGDTALTWHSTAPLWDSAGLLAARTALAAQQTLSREWLVVGDCSNSTQVGQVVTQVNAYETANQRTTVARVSLRDRLPQATKSRTQVRMTGNPSLTFAEVGATGDTITRSAGSWISDGFVNGDTITITGSVSNNVTGTVTTVTDLVLTLGTLDLNPEGPVANVTVTGTATLTFAEVGATGDTITRSRGSWLDDGFRVGDLITVSGTASNNFTAAAGLAGVTATVLTLGTDDLTPEVIGSFGVTVTAGETKAQHVSNLNTAMASIAAEKRIDLGFGRARIASPLLGYEFRRSSAWHIAMREFQHDVHKASWYKAFGPLSDVSFTDANNNVVEFDERVDGGALAARFSCLRTWANGPAGVYIARSLTRAGDDLILGDTHNMHVANVACTTVQASTEEFTGRDVILQSNGTMTPEERSKLEAKVNSDLEQSLLRNVAGEGPRASKAVWQAAPDDVLNVPNATINGVLSLLLKGTIVHVNTQVRVQSGG